MMQTSLLSTADVMDEPGATLTESAPSATSAATAREDWLRLAFVGLPAGRCRQALQQWRQPAALLA
ncbi:MAG TPA: hypothetical protein VNA16_04745, partial [Abditibacteriaceae bacterium]|nr:hypothetical protein [Abditibacteriaceae bacterium]